jgi:hypothetical protein
VGLDWNPLNKPKPGAEAEFEKVLAKLLSGSRWRQKSRRARFEEISITPYETLGTPRVGSSEQANRPSSNTTARDRPNRGTRGCNRSEASM